MSGDVELPAGFPRPFGPYQLLMSYGRGGMGEVFLAQRAVGMSEELCVLKTLRRDLCTDKSYVRRFLDEARIVVRLVHPNICGVFDVGQAGDEYFMTMEHVAGTNLRELLADLSERGERMPMATALWIGAEMLAALSYAHHCVDPKTGQSLRVVHRDVSPHNVMIGYDGSVKLIDFGLAESALKQEQTESHVVMGKVAYMSPEQARGDDVDATCDQFSAAIAIYECLTQDRFYGAMTTPQIWAVAGLGNFAPRQFRELPAELQSVLGRALAASPRDRFTSCAEFGSALDDVRRRHKAGMADCAAIMERLFADRIASFRAIDAQFATARSASAPPRAERAVSLHASRGEGLEAPISLTLARPVNTQRVRRETSDVEATARVDRSGSLPIARSSRGVVIAAAAAALSVALVVIAVALPAERERPVVAPATLEPATLEPAALANVGALEPAQLEPANVDALAPAKLEPTKVAPATPEPTKLEPAHVDRLEPANVEPAHVDGLEPSKAEPSKVEPAKVAPVKAVEPKPKAVKPVVEPSEAKVEPEVVPAPEVKPDVTERRLVFGYERTKSVLASCAALAKPPGCVGAWSAKVANSTSEAELTGALSPGINKCIEACLKAR